MPVNKNDIENYAMGAGVYYLMVFGTMFYPAIVMMQQFGSMEGVSSGHFGGLIKGLFAGGLIILVIWRLFLGYVRYKYIWSLLILIGIYLFFLCPFIQYVVWLFNPDYSGVGPDRAPFGGFDWSLPGFILLDFAGFMFRKIFTMLIPIAIVVFIVVSIIKKIIQIGKK